MKRTSVAVAVGAVASIAVHAVAREGSPADPRRFMSVTEWRGQYTIEVKKVESGSWDEHDEERRLVSRFSSRIRANVRTTVQVKLKRGDVEASGGTWSGSGRGLGQFQTRVWSLHQSFGETGVTASTEKTTTARPSLGPVQFEREDIGSLVLDTGAGKYDFNFMGEAVTLDVTTVERRYTQGEGTSVESHDSPLANFQGTTLNALQQFPAMPAFFGPPPPTRAPDPMELTRLRFDLPASGMILEGKKSFPLIFAFPRAPFAPPAPPLAGEVEMAWRFVPATAEMIFEPEVEGGGDFKSWLPAPTGDAFKGKRVRVKAKLLARGGEQPRGKIKFRLHDVTRHKGQCTNFPTTGEAKDDLRLAEQQPDGIVRKSDTEAETRGEVAEATVLVEAMDTGAWGQLEARCDSLNVVAEYEGRDQLTLPRDDDENHVADAWEKEMNSSGMATDWDEDDQPKEQRRAGDGFTHYEEYRGFLTADEGLVRTDPWKKDLFVVDTDGLVKRYFGSGGNNPAKVEVHLLRTDQLKWKANPRSAIMASSWDPDHRWVNSNSDPSEWYARQFALHVDEDTNPNYLGETYHVQDLHYRNVGRQQGYRTPAGAPITGPKFNQGSSLRWTLMVAISRVGIARDSAGYLANLGRLEPQILAAHVQKQMRITTIHEIGHALGIGHHETKAGETDDSIRQGVADCAMRYQANEERGANGRPRPPQYRYCTDKETFRNGELNGLHDPNEDATAMLQAHDCFRRIDVKCDP